MKTSSSKTYQSELVFQTIHNYLNPEMRILVSGFGLSFVPFPWIFFKNFTGCFHELNKDYISEICQDDKGGFIKSSKSLQVSDVKLNYDLVMCKSNNYSMLEVLITYIKPGGLLFFRCDCNEPYVKETFLEFDFEIIECFEELGGKNFLVKKGWI